MKRKSKQIISMALVTAITASLIPQSFAAVQNRTDTAGTEAAEPLSFSPIEATPRFFAAADDVWETDYLFGPVKIYSDSAVTMLDSGDTTMDVEMTVTDADGVALTLTVTVHYTYETTEDGSVYATSIRTCNTHSDSYSAAAEVVDGGFINITLYDSNGTAISTYTADPSFGSDSPAATVAPSPTVSPSPSPTPTVRADGTCGDNLTWELYTDGNLVISGTGAMDNYSSNTDAPWYSYRTSITSLTVNSGVTTIGDYAFADYDYIKTADLSGGTENGSETDSEYVVTVSSVTLPDTLTSIGKYAFRSSDGIEEITIPASVTNIHDYAFFYMRGLKNIYVESGNTTFSSIDGVLVYNGDSSLLTYPIGRTDTEYTIPSSVKWIGRHAFYAAVNLEKINFSEGLVRIREYGFRHCTNLSYITLPETLTTINNGAFSQCYNLSGAMMPRNTETIGDAVFEESGSSVGGLTLYVYAGSYAEEWASGNGYQYDYRTVPTSDISLSVKNENGTTVTEGYTVSWYADASDNVISSGTTLTNAEEGKEYYYQITLDDTLGLVYTEPARTLVTAGSENTEISVTLKKLQTAKISGTVVNESGEAISGAAVTITQTINKTHTKTVSTVSGADGSFGADMVRAATKVTVTMDGYYDGSVSKSITAAEANVGQITLKKLPDTKITLTLKKLSAAKSGEEPVSATVSSFENITFEVYNVTQDRAIEDFAAQYPNISIDPTAVSAGDEIKITASDTSGTLKSEPVTVTLGADKTASGTISFKENGKLSVSGISGSTSSVAMIFGSDGKLIKKYEVTSSLMSDTMSEGSYKLVIIKRTNLLRSVSDISKLSEMGLVSGTDYFSSDFSVSDGVITVINSAAVADFDESKLYYTVDSETYYVSNKSSVAAGRLIKMQAKYKIEDKYSSSAEQLIFELPDGVYFTGNSLLVNGKTAPYQLDGNRVTVNINAKEASACFYVSADTEGTYSLNAYLSFTENGSAVTQPIGTAQFAIEGSVINITKKTANTTVPVNGVAAPKSDITVYLDGEAVIKTSSNANGNWSAKLDLGNPYNLSTHTVQVEITTPYGVVIKTKEYSVMYDKMYPQLSKVTMYNTGDHGQNITVFDFLNPKKSSPSYRMYPGRYKDFTFTIEFTGRVNSAVLYVKTRSGSTYSYNADYDPDKELWIVNAKYGAFNDAPVNVAVDFVPGESETIVSREEIDDIQKEYLAAVEDANAFDEKSEEYSSELDTLFGSMQEDNLSDEELTERMKAYLDKSIDYFSFLAGDESVSDESEEYDFSGMTNEEISDFLENEYQANAIFINEELKELESLSEEGSDIAQNLEIKDCSGLTAENLLNDGFQCVKMTDESDIYIKTTETEVHMVDFKNNTYQILSTTATASLQGILSDVDLLANGSPGVDANEVLKNLGEKILSLQLAMNSCLEEFENLTHELLSRGPRLRKRLMKAQKIYENEMKLLEQADFDIVTNQINRIQKTKKEITELVNAVKLMQKIEKTVTPWVLKLGKAFKKYDIIGRLYSICTNAQKCWDLYKQLPEKSCMCNKEQIDAVKSDVYWLIGEIAVYTVTDVVGLIITITGITGGSLAGVVFTGGLATVGVISAGIACLAIQFGCSIAMDNLVASKTEEIKQKAAAAICIFPSCLCHSGGECECDEDPDPTPTPKANTPANNIPDSFCPQPPANPICDPSGYVCEAVPSNRVEGVTTTAYYLADVLDDFGEPTGEKTAAVWDAEDYDQINPLITDTNGEYEWDVPEGEWQVKYEKEGYETAYSEWLPVPPPQTEVHIAMVSERAPEVKSVNAYSTGVRIEFSQYMDIDSVSTDNVTVTSNGAAVTGSIAPLNAEESFDDPDIKYASVFMFTFDSEISGEAEINIKNAKSYNTKTLAENYRSVETAEKEPENLSVSETAQVDYDGETEITVQVVPAEAGANKSISVKSSSPSMMSVDNDVITTDAEGKASVTVKGNLPGSGKVTFTLDGTDIAADVIVTVGDVPADKKRTVPVEVTGAAAGNKIIIAAYSSSGAMLDCMSFDASGAETEAIKMECDSKATSLKIMEWNSLNGMTPVRKSVTQIIE